jgi:hypothetical protein
MIMHPPWKAPSTRFLALCMPQNPFCGMHTDGKNAGNDGVVCLHGGCIDFHRKMQTENLALHQHQIHH